MEGMLGVKAQILSTKFEMDEVVSLEEVFTQVFTIGVDIAKRKRLVPGQHKLQNVTHP